MPKKPNYDRLLTTTNQENCLARRYKKNKNAPVDKVTLCLKCCVPSSTINTNKYCKFCKSDNSLHTFDSAHESVRYIYLKDQPNISSIDVQHRFYYGTPKAQYSDGYICGSKKMKPTFIKHYPCKIKSRAYYTADFVYYDETIPTGWVVEEFKCQEDDVDQYAKDRFNKTFDEHSEFGSFCFAYPEANIETFRGKDLYRSYKRLFIDRTKSDMPQYKDYNKYFNEP